MFKLPTAAVLCALILAGCVGPENESEIQQNSNPSGVTPTLLSRGTLPPFKVKSQGDVRVEVTSKDAVDIITRKHDYVVGGHTGWHTHPGPVLITVTIGTVTFYEADDETCTPTVVPAGKSYVDHGRGHYGRNEGTIPAQDITVIFAPVALPFRGEIDPPGNCPF